MENKKVFALNYQKNKFPKLIPSLTETLNLTDIQNFNPLLTKFFDLTVNNYNDINYY